MSDHKLSVFDRAHEAAAVIRDRAPRQPAVGLILGSGLGAFVETITEPVVIPYGDIPHLPRPTVSGHHGNLVVGTIGGTPVAVFQGRFHHYEGHGFEAVTFPIRILQALDASIVVVTAAVGGIAPELAPGDLVVVRDHLNLIGANPLRGPNDDRLGVRFLDLTEVYSRRLRDLAMAEAARLGLRLRPGVYACMPGPCYETPAEILMLRAFGADVVGMSTVPEAIVARHAGMDVLAFAVVSNLAAGISPTPLDHVEVLEAGRHAVPRLGALLEAVLPKMDVAGR